LSLKHHPDRNNGQDKNGIFAKINQAYEILSDPAKKKSYDFKIKMGMDFNPSEEDIDITDIFSQLFSGMGRDKPSTTYDNDFIDLNEGIPIFPGGPKVQVFHTSGNIPPGMMPPGMMPPGMMPPGMMPSGMKQSETTKNSPIEKKLEITIEQAYNGCTIPVTIERTVNDGNLKYNEQETLYINIPKGIDDNEIIVIEGKGDTSINRKNGDVKIFISVKGNGIFDREGLDLIYHKHITFKESFCGVTFQIEHLNEQTFKINGNPGQIIRDNQKKIIKNLGFIRNEHKGNLIINFHVSYPDKLTEKQLKTFQEIL
jgi:DnaJ-class molecular chaperone